MSDDIERLREELAEADARALQREAEIERLLSALKNLTETLVALPIRQPVKVTKAEQPTKPTGPQTASPESESMIVGNPGWKEWLERNGMISPWGDYDDPYYRRIRGE